MRVVYTQMIPGQKEHMLASNLNNTDADHMVKHEDSFESRQVLNGTMPNSKKEIKKLSDRFGSQVVYKTTLLKNGEKQQNLPKNNNKMKNDKSDNVYNQCGLSIHFKRYWEKNEELFIEY